MEIRVYNKQLEPLGIIDEIITTIWQPTYWQMGSFDDCKILAPVTEKNNKLLVKDNIIVLHSNKEDYSDAHGNWRRAMHVSFRHITKDARGTEKIEIRGSFLKKWLSKRVLIKDEILIGTPQKIIQTLIQDNIGAPAGVTRSFGQFKELNVDANLAGDEIEYKAIYGKDLGEVVYDIALAGKLGYDILVNEREHLYGFWLYKGADMSNTNTEGNTPCIFSRDFDNVIEQEYTESIEKLKNVCYCEGAKDKDGQGIRLEIDRGQEKGIERQEFFKSMTNISWKYKDENGNEREIDAESYKKLMTTEANAQLNSCGLVINFESDINTSQNLKYKEDFNVGDIVTTIEKKWGIKIDARITEIGETWQSGKYSLSVTFGEALPTLLEQIKKVRG